MNTLPPVGTPSTASQFNLEPLPPGVHTGKLLEEIVNHSQHSIYRQPIAILAGLLDRVGRRAIELNDPELNALMVRLTIYSVADPESPDYDPVLVDETLWDAFHHGAPLTKAP